MSDWLIIGISGVTCSGKTSLSDAIQAELPTSVIINQDDYFLPTDSPQHILIPELNYINFDIISSLDMKKMHSDILELISHPQTENGTMREARKVKVLIIEGFLIFSYKPISDLCDLRYFLTLSKDQCWERRKYRTYDPPDCPGYFDKIVWPEYLKHRSEILNDKSLDGKIKFIDGLRTKKSIFDEVYTEIKSALHDCHDSGTKM